MLSLLLKPKFNSENNTQIILIKIHFKIYYDSFFFFKLHGLSRANQSPLSTANVLRKFAEHITESRIASAQRLRNQQQNYQRCNNPTLMKEKRQWQEHHRRTRVLKCKSQNGHGLSNEQMRSIWMIYFPSIRNCCYNNK